LRLVSGKAGAPVGPDTKVQSAVGFGKNTRGEGFNLDIELKVVDHGLDPATIEDLIGRAHAVCPYLNATRGNVDVRLSAGRTRGGWTARGQPTTPSLITYPIDASTAQLPTLDPYRT